MIMKKKVLAASIAMALTGSVANAALSVREAGIGHALIVPYFTTQNGNTTLLSITNTDPVNAKAVKVRFRAAVDSDDVFDFQVFLSPNDVWTANVSQDAATGLSKLTTTDTSCTIPDYIASATGNLFSTGRLVSYTDANSIIHTTTEQTREGYVEIFNMADIPASIATAGATNAAGFTGAANALFTAVKHVAGTPPCRTSTASYAALTNIEANAIATSTAVITVPAVNDGTGTVGAAAYATGQQLMMPTTGLLGNWAIINVPKTLTFSGENAAIQALPADQTMIVYSSQFATARTAVNVSANSATNTFPALSLTEDGVLLNSNSGVQAAAYDFPDMSTPYLANTASLTPLAQASNLSASLQRNSMMNEFYTDSAVSGATDWVASLPTRRYHVAGRGAVYTRQDTGVTTAGFAAVTPPFSGSVNVATCTGSVSTAVVAFATNGRSATVTTAAPPALYNREEGANTCASSQPVISPNTPTQPSIYRLAGEVNVLSWNNTGSTSSVLGGSVILANIASSVAGSVATAGWASLSLSDGTSPAVGGALGLPLLGTAYLKAQNGTSNFYGLSFDHRYK